MSFPDDALIPVVSFNRQHRWDLGTISSEILSHRVGSKHKPVIKLVLGSKNTRCEYPSKKHISRFLSATKKVKFKHIKLVDIPLGKVFIGCLKNCQPRELIFDDVLFDETFTLKLLQKFFKSRNRLTLVSFRRNLKSNGVAILAKAIERIETVRWWDIKDFELSLVSPFLLKDNLTTLRLEHLRFKTIYNEIQVFKTMQHCINLKNFYLRSCKIDFFSKFEFSLMTVYSHLKFTTKNISTLQNIFNMKLPPRLESLNIHAKIPDYHLRGFLSEVLRMKEYNPHWFVVRSFRLQAMMKYLIHEHDEFYNTSITQRALTLRDTNKL